MNIPSDWLIGDNFLRSVYAVYDFGDFDSSGHLGDPFVRLLSTIDPVTASADFAAVRGSQARTNITYNASPGPGGGSGVSLSQKLSNTLDKLNMYIPAILAVMALNALVIVILIILGIVYLCRRRRRATARKMKGRASPMPLNSISQNFRTSENSVSQHHTYEPVSMALTEATFVPPSPGFRKDSTASGTRPATYHPIGTALTDDQPFPLSPQSPLFLSDTRPSTENPLQTSNPLAFDRPNSIA
jgi:saccharopepsin